VLKIGLAFITIFLISGCISKEEQALMDVYLENKTYNQKLQKTEKVQLYNTDEEVTKVLVTATYLYKQKAKETKKEDEVFVVGVYVEESDIENFSEEGFSLSLDGKSAKSIQMLEETSPYLEDISFVAPWTQFYLVHFTHTSKKSFNLLFTSELYGKGTLQFAKVAKYVLNKKAF